MEDSRSNGLCFNVGTGIATSIRELASTIASLNQKSIEVKYENIKEGEFSLLVEGKKRNKAELSTMLLDISKAKQILDWEPKVSLKDGLKNEYLWACKNLKRWDKIYSTQW